MTLDVEWREHWECWNVGHIGYIFHHHFPLAWVRCLQSFQTFCTLETSYSFNRNLLVICSLSDTLLGNRTQRGLKSDKVPALMECTFLQKRYTANKHRCTPPHTHIHGVVAEHSQRSHCGVYHSRSSMKLCTIWL